MKKMTQLPIMLLMFLWSTYAFGTYALPGNRAINWSNAGVVGGIPSRTAIYTTLSPSGGMIPLP